MMTNRLASPPALAAAALALGLCAPPEASAQDPARPIALVHARILTMTDEGGTIEDGTVLIRGESIEAVGADVTVPPGAKVIDLHGGTVMPGLVHAWSTAGLQAESSGGVQLPANIPDRFRRRFATASSGNSRPVSTPSKKVAESLYARQDIYGELLDAGVTTLVVRPEGSGLPGMAARLDPAGGDDNLVVGDEAYIVVTPQNTQAAGKALKDMLEKGKKALEERKKPKEEPKKPEEPTAPEGEEKKPADGDAKPAEGETPKPEPKPDPKPDPEPKPTPKPEGDQGGDAAKQDPKPAEEQKKPEPKKDPDIEVLADLLDKQRRAFVNLSTGADFLHWQATMKDLKDVAFPVAIVADSTDLRSGRLDQVLEIIKGFDGPVLTDPDLETLPDTRTLISQPKRLHEAGVEVGFVLPDSQREIEQLWFQLMELVRCGLPAEVALAGITRVPAKALGLDKEVGSLAKGLRADLLVFTGDPLDPTSTLTHVFHGGRSVREETDPR